jgi:hypothetical protein
LGWTEKMTHDEHDLFLMYEDTLITCLML